MTKVYVPNAERNSTAGESSDVKHSQLIKKCVVLHPYCIDAYVLKSVFLFYLNENSKIGCFN